MRDKKGRFIKGHKNISGFGKGSKHTRQARKKISQSLMGKTGSKSRRWKGDKAGYIAKHMWVKKQYGKPYKCENKKCTGKSKRFTWANLSGLYHRKKKDWKMMCQSCNLRHDFYRDITCCPSGHKYNKKNTLFNIRGHRECRQCIQERRGK